jgi:exodeoxyribonuclease VII large subunit
MSEGYSLYELNERIKEALSLSLSEPVWVRAEISELRENANGHCYLELIEKEGKGDRIIAKNKAMIWSYTYRMLKPYFESSTGQPLRSGIQILAACTVEYHEVYGLSLNITDIDPTYTLGEMALRRQQILQQLRDEGIADMNKELALPLLPQRVAIISSETAAGYGDFIDQLTENNFGYRFYHRIFPAVMQGDRAEKSIIEALDAVYKVIDRFDVVVIIRGGGATADLSCFDRYSLAVHCTQFPLPIFTGIGHQRDETILDSVAFACLKTPTAVAEFLIDKMQEADELLQNTITSLTVAVTSWQERYQQQLTMFTRKFPQLLIGRTADDRLRLSTAALQLQQAASSLLIQKQHELSRFARPVIEGVQRNLTAKKHALSQLELKLAYTNPLSILEKGYSMTYANGKRITGKNEVQPGDTLITALQDGTVESKVVE